MTRSTFWVRTASLSGRFWTAYLEEFKADLRREVEQDIDTHRATLREQTETAIEDHKGTLLREINHELEKWKVDLKLYEDVFKNRLKVLEESYRLVTDAWFSICSMEETMFEAVNAYYRHFEKNKPIIISEAGEGVETFSRQLFADIEKDKEEIDKYIKLKKDNAQRGLAIDTIVAMIKEVAKTGQESMVNKLQDTCKHIQHLLHEAEAQLLTSVGHKAMSNRDPASSEHS